MPSVFIDEKPFSNIENAIFKLFVKVSVYWYEVIKRMKEKFEIF